MKPGDLVSINSEVTPSRVTLWRDMATSTFTGYINKGEIAMIITVIRSDPAKDFDWLLLIGQEGIGYCSSAYLLHVEK